MIGIRLMAQDSTPEPAPPPSIEATHTPTVTLTPTTTATLSPTDTETATATDTAPLSPEATAELTESVIATQTLIPTAAIETLPPTTPLDVTPVAEKSPPLMSLYGDGFDSGDLSRWSVGEGWVLINSDSGGYALQTGVADQPLSLLDDPRADVQAWAIVALHEGAGQMRLRESAAGSYALTFDSSGILTLSRAEQVVAQTAVAWAEGWHMVGLSAFGTAISVWFDGSVVLTWQDAQALPAGTFSLRAVRGLLRVDDVQLSIPEALTAFETSALQSGGGPAYVYGQTVADSYRFPLSNPSYYFSLTNPNDLLGVEDAATAAYVPAAWVEGTDVGSGYCVVVDFGTAVSLSRGAVQVRVRTSTLQTLYYHNMGVTMSVSSMAGMTCASTWSGAIWNTIYTTANWGWFGPSNGTFGYNGTVRSIRLDFRMKSYQGRYRNAHVDAVRVYGVVVPPTATPTPTPTSTPTIDPCGGSLNAVSSSEGGAELAACQPIATATPIQCTVTLISLQQAQSYPADKTQELKDMGLFVLDANGNVTGINSVRGAMINARPFGGYALFGNSTAYVVHARVEYPQNVNGVSDKQIWYQVGPIEGYTWLPIRYDGVDYSDVPDICSSIPAPETLTFTYDRAAAANYAIEHSYDTLQNHAALVAQQRVTQRLTTTSVPFAEFRYGVLGTDQGTVQTTGSAVFVSESIWMGGMPMTVGDTDSCQTAGGTTKGWRYCYTFPSPTPPTQPYGESSNPFDTHEDLLAYWSTGLNSILLGQKGQQLLMPGGSLSNSTQFIFGGSALTATDHDLNLVIENLHIGYVEIGNESAVSARVQQLLTTNAQNPQLQMGDYIYINTVPTHGLLVIGWQEAKSCAEALQGYGFPGPQTRNWSIGDFGITYSDAITNKSVVNPVPYVVDFTDPALNNPTPRPFYCTRFILGDDTPDEYFNVHNWYFFTLPSTLTLPYNANPSAGNDLHIDQDWNW